MVPAVQAAGFEAVATGPDYGSDGSRLPLLAPDPVKEDHDLREGFARRAASLRGKDILELAGTWRPDLVVCDEVDFGAMIAAERLGVPHASVLVTASGGFVRASVVASALDDVRASFGLPADPALAMLERHLVLSPFPPGFRDPAYSLPVTARTFRPQDPVEADGEAIYFTLGTIFNTESGDLFQRVLTGLRELEVPLVMTVGEMIDPAEFGPQPSHVRIERFVPQASVLPTCRLVVSHGGSGSLTGALAHGLPSVLIPLGADQLMNGARVAALGLGLVLDPVSLTPAGIRDAAADVLTDPSYLRVAAGLRAEMAAQPGVSYTVGLLEGLVPA